MLPLGQMLQKRLRILRAARRGDHGGKLFTSDSNVHAWKTNLPMRGVRNTVTSAGWRASVCERVGRVRLSWFVTTLPKKIGDGNSWSHRDLFVATRPRCKSHNTGRDDVPVSSSAQQTRAYHAP